MRLLPVLSLLFGGRLSASDIKTLDTTLGDLGQAVKDRFQGLDAEIEDLRKEIAALKAEPRTSLAQRLRTKK